MSSDGDGWGDPDDGADAVSPSDGGGLPTDRGEPGGRVEAGVDSSLAPWETDAGTGGFVRALGESIGFILLALVAAAVLSIGGALAMLFAGFELTSAPVLVVSLVGSQAGFALGALAFLRWRGEPLSNVGLAVPDIRGVVLVAVGLVATLVISVTVGAVVQQLGLQAAENSTTSQASSDPTQLLVLVPFMLLVVGPCEELLFRGIVQRRIRERASAPVAIALGGALFASIHFIALIGDLSEIATTIGVLFFPSLVFGALYEYGKNIVVNALVHGLYNSVILLITYAAFRFGPEETGSETQAAVVDAVAALL